MFGAESPGMAQGPDHGAGSDVRRGAEHGSCKTAFLSLLPVLAGRLGCRARSLYKKIHPILGFCPEKYHVHLGKSPAHGTVPFISNEFAPSEACDRLPCKIDWVPLQRSRWCEFDFFRAFGTKNN
jgi:hypothetical protein